MHVWDYNLKRGWKPKTDSQWIWYLGRKINLDDWKGLRKADIKRYFTKLIKRLDPGKKKMLESYFKVHG